MNFHQIIYLYMMNACKEYILLYTYIPIYNSNHLHNTSVFDNDEGFRQQLSHWRHVIDLTTPRRAKVVHRGASCAPYCSPEGLAPSIAQWQGRRVWCPRLFHSLLAQHWRQAICLPPRLCKETVSGFEKIDGGNFHQSRESTVHCSLTRMHCTLRIPSLY